MKKIMLSLVAALASICGVAAEIIMSDPTANITVNAGDTLVIGAESSETPVEVTGVISGKGAVKIKGDVVMKNVKHSFSGGLTVESGTLSATHTATSTLTPFGAQGSTVTVTNEGACVDLAKTNDGNYKYIIAGKGIQDKNGNWSGVLKNTNMEYADNHANTESITLKDNALIVLDKKWGLITKSYAPTTIDLGGKTLTKRGEGMLMLVNTTIKDGVMRFENGELNIPSGKNYNKKETHPTMSNARLCMAGDSILSFNTYLTTTTTNKSTLEICPGDGEASADGVVLQTLDYTRDSRYGTDGLEWVMTGGTLDLTNHSDLSTLFTKNNLTVTGDSTIRIKRGVTLAMPNKKIVSAADLNGTEKLTFTTTDEGTGTATVDLGTQRPTVPLCVGANVKLKMKLNAGELKFDLIMPDYTTGDEDALKAVLDVEGLTDYDVTFGANDKVTISKPMPSFKPEVTTTEGAVVDFSDTTETGKWLNWEEGATEITIDLTGSTVPVTINLGDTEWVFNNIYVKGGQTVQFEGSITASGTLFLADNATLIQSVNQIAPNVAVNAGSTLVLEAATGATLNSTAVISGAGAVITKGDVVMAAANTFTGGLTVASGTVSMSVKNGYGASGSRVTVLDGACADVNYTGTTVGGYRFTIEGSDSDGKCALTNSVDIASRYVYQPIEIKLTNHAVIDVTQNWGVQNWDGSGMEASDYYEALFDLGGYALTKRGDGNFWLTGVTVPENSSGTVRIEAGRVYPCRKGCDFTGLTLELAETGIWRYETDVTGLTAIKFVAGNDNNTSNDKSGVEQNGGSLAASIPWIMAGGTWDTTTDTDYSVLTCPAEKMSVTSASTIKIANGKTLTLSNTSLVPDATAEGEKILTFKATSGTATVDFGKKHPKAPLKFDGNVKVKLQLADSNKIDLKIPDLQADDAEALAAFKANLTLTDASGNPLGQQQFELNLTDGTLTIDVGMATWKTVGENLNFTDGANWGLVTYPTDGALVFELAAGKTATITIPSEVSAHAYDSVTVKGGGTVAFVGDGELKAEKFYIEDNSTLSHSGQINEQNVAVSAGSTLVLDGSSYSTESPLESSSVISGAGAVKTKGSVVMKAANSFTGGLTAESGTLSIAENPKGFGGGDGGNGSNNMKFADANAMVTVNENATVDLNGLLDVCYTYTLAGTIKNSVGAIGNGARQTRGITLTGDALVETGFDWGLIAPDYAQTTLNLNGHTLTKSGSGRFWLFETMATDAGGTLCISNGTLVIGKDDNRVLDSTLTNVDLQLVGGSTLSMAKQLKGLKSLEILPSATVGEVVTISGLSKLETTAWIMNGGTLLLSETAALPATSVTVSKDSTIQVARGKTLTLSDTSLVPDATAEGEKILTFTASGDGEGTATVNFGTNYPDVPIDVGEGVTIKVALEPGKTEFELNMPDMEESKIKEILDVEGFGTSYEVSPPDENGKVTITMQMPTWTPTDGSMSFNNPGNWDYSNGVVPSSGNITIDLLDSTEPVTITVDENYAGNFDCIYVKGGAGVSFTGTGSITAVATDVKVDTDFSGLDIDLGNLTIADSVIVTLDPVKTTYTYQGTTGAIRFKDSTTGSITYTLGPAGSGAEYTDFATAFATAPLDKALWIVKMIGDVTNASTYTFKGGQNITLDLNDYELHVKDVTEISLTVSAGATLTIKDSGKNGTGEFKYSAREKGGISVAGEFTLEGGTINGSAADTKAPLNVYAPCTIKGGKIIVGNANECCVWISNNTDYTNKKLTVTGGTIGDGTSLGILNNGGECTITAADGRVEINAGSGKTAINATSGTTSITGKNVYVDGGLSGTKETLVISGGRYSADQTTLTNFVKSGCTVKQTTVDGDDSWHKVSPPGFSVILR